jgi:hypothetical protein
MSFWFLIVCFYLFKLLCAIGNGAKERKFPLTIHRLSLNRKCDAKLTCRGKYR